MTLQFKPELGVIAAHDDGRKRLLDRAPCFHEQFVRRAEPALGIAFQHGLYQAVDAQGGFAPTSAARQRVETFGFGVDAGVGLVGLAKLMRTD